MRSVPPPQHDDPGHDVWQVLLVLLLTIGLTALLTGLIVALVPSPSPKASSATQARSPPSREHAAQRPVMSS